MLDALDVMLYAFALTAIRSEFGLSAATAGALASVTLLASSFGGAFAGVLADKYGRVRVLVWSILVYSLFTAMTATAQSLPMLLLWRTLVGIGLGGEWSAGSVLVAETWPAEHRGKAIGIMQAGWAIGYLMAAGLSALLLPRYGWRVLFLAGVVPALLNVWIRRSIPEPEIWQRSVAQPRSSLLQIVRPPLLARTLAAVLMSSCVMFAYWGLFSWIPAYLSTPAAQGGAGMDIVKTSAWIVPVQVGAFFGYMLFGFFADRVGRRPAFIVFVAAAAITVPLYTLAGRSDPMMLLLLGPFIGFFGHGYFSVFGAMLAELFPSGVRAGAQGICYNAGRAASALAPVAIGALADRQGIGAALLLTSAFFVAGGFSVLLLPETRGKEL
jgi:MFS family permease